MLMQNHEKLAGFANIWTQICKLEFIACVRQVLLAQNIHIRGIPVHAPHPDLQD